MDGDGFILVSSIGMNSSNTNSLADSATQVLNKYALLDSDVNEEARGSFPKTPTIGYRNRSWKIKLGKKKNCRLTKLDWRIK